MKFRYFRWTIIALCIAVSNGCAVSDGGTGYYGGYGSSVGIGVGYYEPFGADYGGWEPSYYVGPFREEGHRVTGFDRRGGQLPHHTFRSPPASHSLPSIPTRGGGGKPGGNHPH